MKSETMSTADGSTQCERNFRDNQIQETQIKGGRASMSMLLDIAQPASPGVVSWASENETAL